MAKNNNAKAAAAELQKIENYENAKRKKARTRNLVTIIGCSLAAFAIVVTFAIVQVNVATPPEAADSTSQDDTTADDATKDDTTANDTVAQGTVAPVSIGAPAGGGSVEVGADGAPVFTAGNDDWDSSGSVQVKVIEEGTGDVLTTADTISAKYEGWTASDGVSFDGTYTNGSDAISFPLSGVIPGWTYGIAGQKVGSKLAIYIPAIYGYGHTPGAGRPAGPLVFYVDVVSKGATQ
jgi:peptidylprolyl isomerase